MIAALSTWESGLAVGRAQLVGVDGQERNWPVPAWIGGVGDADRVLLDQCGGSTLDVGCGPGRMTAALLERGLPALGIDISPLAVRMARRRGAVALVRDVFDAVPGAGRWENLLLADGNVGIDGHPVRLLQRCRELIAPGGRIHLDLEVPGTGVLVELVRLKSARTTSPPFRWGWLGVDALLPVAAAADLVVHDIWNIDGRWQASLERPR